MASIITIKDPVLARRAKTGEASLMDVVHYLLATYTIMDLAKAMAELLMMEDDIVKPITISEEQFKSHFRIIGQRVTEGGDVVTEKRGRKPGTKIVDGKAVLGE